LFAPYREWAHTDEENPQTPQGPALPPRDPEGASPAAAGPDDTSPAGGSPAEAGPPEKSPAETRPADVTPADARPADTGPAEAGPVDEYPNGITPGTRPAPNSSGASPASPAETSPAETSVGEASAAGAGPVSPAETSPAQTSPAQTSPAETSPAETSTAGAGSVSPAETSASEADPAGGKPAEGSPPRVPARQGPPPKPVPGSTAALPATRPGSAPATRPGTAPATRPGAVPATRPAAGVPARRPAAQPSWGTVLVTTFRLWLHRRMEKTRWRVLAALLLVAIVFGAGAVTIALTSNGPATGTSGTSQGSGTAPGGGGGGALASVTTARKHAAAWVAQQVNADEIIGCDPIMCAALEAAHIQANRLLMLGPGQPDPLGSEILLDTATLRSQFGPRLVSVYAPVSLAAFGSGAARVEVRFVAPDGSQAYLAELAGDVAARKLAGAEMLRNPSIHASPAVRSQLTAGQVDTRLLVTLVTLAHSHPVDIISFGTIQPGASPGVPLRSAEIAGAPGPGSTPAASVQTLRSFLSAQQPPYRPSIVAVKTASRRTVLHIEYPAPSLLGLLGTHG
jgi:hypothetical protein